MTEQLFDVNELFDGLKTFDNNLVQIEKGEKKFFFMALPSEYEGKKKAIVPVQGYFKGQANKNPSYIIRAFEVPLQSNGKPDFENAKFCGLVTNGFVAAKLKECFLPSTELEQRPNLLPDASGKAYLFKLFRPDKNTEFTTSTTSILIPKDLYTKNVLDWSELVTQYNDQQAAFNKKYAEKSVEGTQESTKDSTPWE